MKKFLFSVLSFLTFLVLMAFMSGAVFSHTMWVYGDPVKPGKKATIIRGYGDMFPINNQIEERRLAFLPAPELIGPDGKKIPLTSDPSNNYTWTTDFPLVKGSYLVLGEYSPTYWTQTKENGWFIKPMNDKEVKGTVIDAYLTVSFAKGILNVGGALDTDLITKPLGAPIEIVPLTNPEAHKVNDLIKFKVLFRGEPLPGVLVTGMVAGYGGDHEFKAWAFLTDDEGIVKFIPWKKGPWQIECRYGIPPEDKKKSIHDYWNAKLSFVIK